MPTPDLSPSALLSHLISVRLSLLERLLGHRFDIAWRQEPCQSEDAHAVFHGDTLLRLLSSVYGHDQCHRICRGIVRSGSKPAISDPLLISLNEENILKFTLSENGKLTGRSAPVTSECSAEDLSSRSNVAQLLRAVPPEGEVDGSSPCGGSRSEVNDGADISADKPSTDTPRRQLPIALTIGRSALSLRFRRQQTPEITHQEARNLRKKSKSVSTLRTSEAVGKFGRKPLAAIEKGEGKRPLQKSNRSTEKKMSQETSLTDSGQGDSACLGGTGRGRQLQGSHLPLINTSTSSKCYRLKSGKKASLRGRGESFKLPLIDGSDCCLRECDGPPSSSTCPPSGVHNCTRKTSLEMLIEDALSRDISGQIGRYRVTKFKDTGESMRDEHTELSSAEQSSDYLIDMRSMQQLPTEPQMYGTERATAGPVDTSHLSQQTSNSEQSLADSQQPMELSAHENVYENTDPQMCGRSKVGNLIDTLRVASSLVGETSRKSQLSDTSGEVNKATSAADSDRYVCCWTELCTYPGRCLKILKIIFVYIHIALIHLTNTLQPFI